MEGEKLVEDVHALWTAGGRAVSSSARGKRNAEPLGQAGEVAPFPSGPRPAEVMPQLEVGGEAAHARVADGSRSREPVGRVEAPGVAAELLPPVPLLVEDEWVEIDLPARGVTEDDARRRPGSCGVVDGIAGFGELGEGRFE